MDTVTSSSVPLYIVNNVISTTDIGIYLAAVDSIPNYIANVYYNNIYLSGNASSNPLYGIYINHISQVNIIFISFKTNLLEEWGLEGLWQVAEERRSADKVLLLHLISPVSQQNQVRGRRVNKVVT